jgi:hypothetical protein
VLLQEQPILVAVVVELETLELSVMEPQAVQA